MKKLFLMFLFLSSMAFSQTYVAWSADVNEEGIVIVNCELSGDILMSLSTDVNGFDAFGGFDNFDDLDGFDGFDDFVALDEFNSNYLSEDSLELEVSVDEHADYSIIHCELVDIDTYETLSRYSFEANNEYYIID